MKRSHAVLVIGSTMLCVLTLTAGQKTTVNNSPTAKVKDTNTLRIFPYIQTNAEWEKRAQEIRE